MNDQKAKPLFIAPIDLQGDDEVVLFLGNPIRIKRDGVEIWLDPNMPEELFETLINSVDEGKNS